jgi:dTDP-4-amino-4,6-dideoxygalactose transaminase
LTFCATVNCILHAGAEPVLADVGPDGNLDPACVASCITPRTRAILPVHLGGLPCDMERIWDLAARFQLCVIEDAAHASGAWHRGAPVGGASPSSGRVSDAVAFSFYATKNLTTGEGGMVTTHDAKLAEDMRVLCLHGISRDAWQRYGESGRWYYEVLECGFKYNLSDVQSAIGLHQLARLDEFTRVRARYAAVYNDAFAGSELLETPCDDARHRHAWHLYPIRLRLDRLAIDRGEFIDELRRRNIGASVHFIPIQLHPYYVRRGFDPGSCPRALELYPRLVSLPLYPAMTEQQVDYVARAVNEVLKANRLRTFSAGGAEI